MEPTPLRILLVDDDEDLCRYAQSVLEDEGHTVQFLTDAALVEEEFRRGDYHVVILDLLLPNTHGIDVLRRLRGLDRDVAVVILTGRPGMDSAVAAMQLGATDYVLKPFKIEAFRRVLARIMRSKGMLRSPEERLHKLIGDTIRGLRKDRDLTLKHVSRRTGLSISLLSQIERAEASPSIASMYKIARALDTPIQALFGSESAE